MDLIIVCLTILGFGALIAYASTLPERLHHKREMLRLRWEQERAEQLLLEGYLREDR